MKRIVAILKGKLEDLKLDNKVKRVENALDAAKLNAETDLMEAQAGMEAAVAKLSEDGVNVTDVINSMKRAIERQREIQEGLNDIDAIKKFLNEEVKVEKEK